MAKKIKFALEMNGVKIRSMEELQENFDLNAAVQYLLDGKLLTWLEDRLYDEAEQIAELDKNAPDMKEQLCEILGVEYEDDSGLDVYDLERLNEKKRILNTMTDDEEIIANADKTALNQEDLADLLNADEDTIYLCGENFSVSVKFCNKKYVGILGKPKVKIKAANQAELDNKNIIFENVTLPWGYATSVNETEHNETTLSYNDEHDITPSQNTNTSSTEEIKDQFIDIPMWMREKTRHKASGVTSSTTISTYSTKEIEKPFIDIPMWMRKQ